MWKYFRLCLVLWLVTIYLASEKNDPSFYIITNQIQMISPEKNMKLVDCMQYANMTEIRKLFLLCYRDRNIVAMVHE
jgi:hypothetical protein